MRKGSISIFIFAFCTFFSASVQADKMVNPVTDVCWKCLFPIHFGGVNVTPGYNDFTSHSLSGCACASPPKVGVPLAYWQPSYLVDVTRHPYKMVGLGGARFTESKAKNMGTVNTNKDGSKDSFYHVHLYTFPVLSVMSLFDDFDCVDGGEIECAYMSELDPLWNDEGLALINNAEAGLFANQPAQLACIADCLACSAGKPQDKLFWCSGCEGSLYPFTGKVSTHIGGVQASFLLTHRLLAKLHRNLFLKGYPNKEYCEAKYLAVMPKSIYKAQLVCPKSDNKCHPLGKSDLVWGAGKSYPIKGEDFCYLIWSKKQCCIDALEKIVMEGMDGF